MSIYGDGMPTAHHEFYALSIIIVDDVVIIVIVYIHIHEQTTYSRTRTKQIMGEKKNSLQNSTTTK